MMANGRGKLREFRKVLLEGSVLGDSVLDSKLKVMAMAAIRLSLQEARECNLNLHG